MFAVTVLQIVMSTLTTLVAVVFLQRFVWGQEFIAFKHVRVIKEYNWKEIVKTTGTDKVHSTEGSASSEMTCISFSSTSKLWPWKNKARVPLLSMCATPKNAIMSHDH